MCVIAISSEDGVGISIEDVVVISAEPGVEISIDDDAEL